MTVSDGGWWQSRTTPYESVRVTMFSSFKYFLRFISRSTFKKMCIFQSKSQNSSKASTRCIMCIVPAHKNGPLNKIIGLFVLETIILTGYVSFWGSVYIYIYTHTYTYQPFGGWCFLHWYYNQFFLRRWLVSGFCARVARFIGLLSFGVERPRDPIGIGIGHCLKLPWTWKWILKMDNLKTIPLGIGMGLGSFGIGIFLVQGFSRECVRRPEDYLGERWRKRRSRWVGLGMSSNKYPKLNCVTKKCSFSQCNTCHM